MMYEDHYGLTGRPFALTPDPRFWVETATHRKAMAYLGYGLAQGEGFIVVTGDIGAGKTTLVGHLMETLDRTRLQIVHLVSTQVSSEDLLRTVAEGTGAPTDGPKAQLLKAIERQLHVIARTGKRTLLIVDEVQALPTESLEELRMLSNFQGAGHALLQIVLLGQPEFRERLNDPRLEQLRQRVIAQHHLDPMAAEEVEQYLAYRLSVVGWTGRPDFDEGAVMAMYQWSGGVPRRLNQLASRLLLYGAMEGIETFEARDVEAVIVDLHGDTPAAPTPAAAAELVAEPVIEWPIVREAATVAVAAGTPVAAMEAEPLGEAAAVEPPADAAPSVDAVPVSVEDPADVEPDAPVEPDEPVEAVEAVEPVEAVGSVEPAEAEARAQEVCALADPEPAPARAGHAGANDIDPQDAVDDAALAARLENLEKRLVEQDEALRRVLTLLVDWVEQDERRVSATELRGEAA